MGEPRLRHRFSRTAAASLLVAAAVAMPCAAWYIVGSRDAEREAETVAGRPLIEARKAAARIADRLTIRLEAIREAEARRPFFQYQSQYIDPRSDCECSTTTPSPLAHGGNDPLIWTYFQIDALGQLTLPTLNEEIHRQRGAAWLNRQAQILEQLIPTAPAVLRAADPGPVAPPPSVAWGDTADFMAAGASRDEVVAHDSWILNMELCGIRTDPLAVQVSPGSPQAEAKTDIPGSVVIHVASFHWTTVTLAGEPALFALRAVDTPIGRFVQGFAVSNATVRRSLSAEEFPATWNAGPPDIDTTAPVSIGGALWHVSVDAVGAAEQARRESASIRAAFLRRFAVGSFLAALAGVGVIGIVRQSDRLARQRSRFAASAAHELRTPLTGMRMYADMLAEGLGDRSKTANYANHISREADRLSRVVTNVMSYSRLERGELEIRRAPGDLASAVRESVEALRPALENAGATVRFRAPEGMGETTFDRDAVFQIVQNLVDNAEKHTRTVPDRAIDIAVDSENGSAAITVSDHGPGVPPRLRGRLFEPFFRSASPDAPAGLGLGLTLVRALAVAHGGQVRYDDLEGGGARFTVLLPTRA